MEFMRSPRLIGNLPKGEIEIEAAPSLGQKPEINWLTVLLPPLAMMTAMCLVPVLISSAGLQYSPMMMLYTTPMMFIGLIVSIINYRSQQKRYKQIKHFRKIKYEQYLNEQVECIEKKADEQRRILNNQFPPIYEIENIMLARKRRLWERVQSDEDFMQLRVGTGSVPLSVNIKTPKLSFTLEEDRYKYEPQKIADEFRNVDKCPIICDLRKYPSVGIIGHYENTRSIVYGLILQAVANHGYDDLKMVLLFSEVNRKDWTWLRWLPHTYDKKREHRYLACGQYQADELLNTLESQLGSRSQNHPYFLFVIDNPSLIADRPILSLLLDNQEDSGIGYILMAEELQELPRNTAQIIITSSTGCGDLYIREHGMKHLSFSYDDIQANEDLTRSLAGVHLISTFDSEGKLPDKISFLEGYGVNSVAELDLTSYWENAKAEEHMQAPIGIAANGDTFYFDINEKENGPHGLVAGMTGSGKSEMIQSWILSMCVQFSPQDISFVLIDFKGTGLILPFKHLPHLAGTISDLDTNINRNLIALHAELQRRKALFDKTGVNNIKGYLKQYHAGNAKEPLSYLFVIIDEYAEFKVNYPEFTAEINSLFRTGRALGVHIILLTQNPSGVISEEAESNVQFRWCLRVSNSGASREILGNFDGAARISNPGRCYVKIGANDSLSLIQSYWSGAPYRPNKEKYDSTVEAVDLTGKRIAIQDTVKSTPDLGNEIDQVVGYISNYVKRRSIKTARKIWMEQLPAKIYLHKMEKKEKSEGITPMVGMLDDPWEQKQIPFKLPLSTGGHTAIVGAPGTGKTTFLQTMIRSLCMEYTAEQVNIYIMDFGSWGMAMFREYPLVGAVADGNDEDMIIRIHDFLERTLDERKLLFSQEGVGSISSYNRACAERLPYIVLVIDNFASLKQGYSEELMEFLERLTREGGSYGMILVATCSTEGLGYKLQSMIKIKVALQMNDPSEYANVVGRTEGLFPVKCVGRGLYRERRVMEFQTALPAPSDDENERSRIIRDDGLRYKAAWQGKTAKKIQIMPKELYYDSSLKNTSGRFVLGLDVKNVEPFYIDMDNRHTLLISGMAKSGKTNLLRLLLIQMQKEQNAKVLLFGSRAEYESVLNERTCFAENGEVFDNILANIAKELDYRQEREGENIVYEPIYILIDGVAHCIDLMSNDSADILKAISHIGRGMGVMLIAAEDISKLNPLQGYWPFLNKMATEQVVLLGGKPIDHLFVEALVSENEKKVMIKETEALICQSNESVRLKVMRSGGR